VIGIGAQLCPGGQGSPGITFPLGWGVDMSAGNVEKMQVIVISGFLGAGKTTLLQNIIHASPKDGRDVILVNDFGTVNIDKKLLDSNKLEVIPLSSGCVCCSMKGNLVTTIQRIHAELNPSRLFIEPSGIASPTQIVETLGGGALASITAIGSVITIVDSVNFNRYRSTLGKFFTNQLQAADIVLINKTDLVTDEHLESIKKSVHDVNPEAKIYPTQFCSMPMTIIFETSHRKHTDVVLKNDEQLPYMESVEVDVEAHSFDKQKLLEFFQGLEKRDYGLILRAKGVFRVEEGYILVNMVPGQFAISPISIAPSKVVFIGKELLQEELSRAILSCIH